MNDGILHEKDEARYGFGPGPTTRLMSLMDILGAGAATCSRCGRWQSFSALCSADAVRELAKFGWRCVVGGDDICPKCVKAESK